MLLSMAGMPLEAEIQKMLTAVHMETWLQEDVFRLQWWFLLGLFILAVTVWWQMLNKTRLPEIILYAVLAMIVMMGIDEYGEELTLWDYPINLFPIFPVIATLNLALLPMVFSLTYQYFPTWKSFSFASIVMSGLLSFVIEPALVWGNFYQLLKWKYHYSFMIYIAVALFIRWSVNKIFGIAEKAQKHL
jgi:hypothetical protein